MGKNDAKKQQLTPLQERFAQQYVISLNATQAYKKVYKCSLKAAESGGSRTLSIAKVAARVKQLQARIMKKTDLSAEMVINELRKLGFSNIKSFAEAGNKIKDISELPDEVTAAVESIQTGPKGTKIKLYDKKAALVDLGRHLGIFEKDNAQKPIVIAPTLTEKELQRRLAAVAAAGNGLDTQSIGEGFGEE